MRVTTRLVLDWDGNILERECFTWNGPIDLCKGNPTTQELAKSGQSASGGLQSTASGIDGTLAPLFQNEIANPQGFGELGLNQLQTAGGQATAGAVGAGNEAANLQASRSGNPASSSSIIDAIARSGMKQQSNNALDIGMENEKAKMAQQGQGYAGFSALGAQDQGAALGYANQATTASNDYQQQRQATLSGILSPILGLGGAVAGAAGTALRGQ